MGLPLAQWTRQSMDEAQGIIFIGACGIAVRSIAPWLRGKDRDPRWWCWMKTPILPCRCFPAMWAGANDLARRAAELTGAQAVVTTATDSGGRFPVDDWAVKQGLLIPCLKDAKRISMAILEGEEVGFCSCLPWKGELPRGLRKKRAARWESASVPTAAANPLPTP